MAATTMIVGTLASTGYGIYAQNKAAKAAQKVQADALATRPNAAADQAKANTAALDAQAATRRRAASMTGRAGTILTGPSGIPNAPPPATKTLLGL